MEHRDDRNDEDEVRRLRAATRAAFEAAPGLQPRPGFAAELAARLRAQPPPLAASRAPQRSWLAMAAAVLLVVAGGLGWRQWSAASASALVGAAIDDHRFCALTRSLAEHPISLEEAALHYGPVYSALGTVEPASGSLAGGPLRILRRHSCVVGGRRFAHIILEYKGQTLSLVVTDDPRLGRRLWSALAGADQTPSIVPVTSGLHVAAFESPRHAVFLVSSLPDDDVREVAKAMAGPVSRALAGA